MDEVLKKTYDYVAELCYNIQHLQEKNEDIYHVIKKYREEKEKEWIEPYINNFREILFSQKAPLPLAIEQIKVKIIKMKCLESIYSGFSQGKIENLITIIDTFCDFQDEIWKPLTTALSWTSDRYILEKLIDLLGKKDFQLINREKLFPLQKGQAYRDMVSLIMCLYEKDLISSPLKNDGEFNYKRIYDTFTLEKLNSDSVQGAVFNVVHNKRGRSNHRKKIDYFAG